MFKGKIWLWVIIIVICFVAQWLIESIPVWTHKDNITIMVDTYSDNDLDSILSNREMNKFKLNITNDASDIIISDSGENIDGYNRYEKYIYSPLVAYACGVESYDDGFIAVPNTSNCYKIDLYSVLIAVEDGKQWSDLGLNEKVASGTVTIYLPNEQSPYYDSVIELFYLTLNKGKVPTETERVSLTNQVNNILSKCHKVADINQIIYQEYQEPSKEHKILIGPEFLYTRGKDSSMGPGTNGRYTNTKQYRPIYFLDTISITADIYVKKDDSKKEITTRFVEAIKNDNAFMNSTGWRVQNYSFVLDSVYYETH